MPPNLKVHKLHQLSGHQGAIFSLAQGDTAPYFLSAGGDGWIVQWDLDDPDPGRLLAKASGQLFSLCYLPQNQQLIAGDMNGGIHWIDLADTTQNKDIDHHKKGVFDIRLINGAVLSVGGDGVLSKWDIAQKRATDSLRLSQQSLRCMAFHPATQALAIGSSDTNIYLLDAVSLEIRQVIHQAHDNSVFSLAFSPDGQHLLSGSRDAHLKTWDIQHGSECISSVPAHLFTINSIVFHPKGHLFATGSRDKTVKIWDASSLKLLKVIENIRDDGHVNSVNKLFWSSYKNCLISCGDDRIIKVWSVEQAVE